MKPNGFWLSDETDSECGWKSWCQGEHFNIEGLKHQKLFSLDLGDCLTLQTYKDISAFGVKYKTKPYPNIVADMWLDWASVAKFHKGLLITPYCWSARLKFMWYYGWDCASACIWDLTCLKEKL